MCRGTRYGEGVEIPLDSIHPDIRSLYKRDYGFIYVDECIYEEMHALLKSGVATEGMSCCGHGKMRAFTLIFPESIGKAKELGYELFKFALMSGTLCDAIYLRGER